MKWNVHRSGPTAPKIVVVEADSLTIEAGCLVFRATPPPKITESVRIVAAYAPWTWKSVWEAGHAGEEKS